MASLSGTGPTFPLFPGEKVARFGPATGHFATRTGFPGVLHLTNQRLVFRPDGNGRLLDARLQEVRNAIPFSVKVLGIIPAGRALRVAIDTGRVSEEPWFNVDDPDAWNAAITEARAGAATPPDLSALLSAAEAEGREAVSRDAFGSFLAHERGFPGGFWHAGDQDGMLDVIGSRLKDLGLPDLLADEKLRAELKRLGDIQPGASDADEDQARRRQISCVAGRVNTVAGPTAGARRLYEFAEDIPGWESDEPVWLLLNADERARLLALGIVRPFTAGRITAPG